MPFCHTNPDFSLLQGIRLLACIVAQLQVIPIQSESISTPKQPNVIIILVDDQGYYDLGCYGATEFKTPHIDRLASEGIRLTDYYAAAPICSPSRAGLLTGCYPKRIGLATWVQRADSHHGIHPGETTLPELFKRQGYATACIGKWHLGFKEPFLPKNQGFDHYFGLLHNLDPVETVYFKEKGGVPLIRNDAIVERPANKDRLTQHYTDEAITFISAHREEPFFLYLPHTMLHNPLGVSEAFQGSSQFGDYGDASQELDYHVGRLLRSLESNEIADRTIVLYLSDNGRGPGRNPDQPLRGRKLSTLEAGIRVPGILWGPGAGIQKGQVSNDVISALDWLPTLATLANIKIENDKPIDGRDLSARFLTPPPTIPSLNAHVAQQRPYNPAGEWASLFSKIEYQDSFFYHGSHGALAAVRWENWKLFLNPTLTLYDLENDPKELKPLRNGKITRKLRGMAVTFQEEMRDYSRPPGRYPPRAKSR